MSFERRRILVVGGAGFIGSNLVRALLESEPCEVLVVDNLLSSERENLPDDDRVRLIAASINDDDVLAGLPDDLEYVFHLSTYHGNQSSMVDPLADHEHNTLTTLKLYETLKDRQGNLKRVVYASAGCTVAEKTFDGAEATQEDAPVSLHLDSPYQISKIIGEYYSNYYFSRHGLPTVKARFQNVYGPGEVLGAGRWRGTVNTVWRNVTPTFIYKALNHEALPVENGGIASRDLIYVEDMARGLIACALRGEPGEVYNLASGAETTIRELAELINDLTGNLTPIALTPARDWDHSGQRYGDPDKSRRELGFEAMMPLRDGLEATIEWMRENREFIDGCIAKHAARMQELEGVPGVSTAAARASSAVTVIEPQDGLAWPDWRELWAHRELIYVLARRDIAVRYKQSFVGALWAVVQPLLLAAVFSLFFGLLADIDSGRPGVPYPVFAVLGMVTWLFFTSALLTVSSSTVSSASLLSKVYFPRLVIPLAALLSPVVDFAIALCVALAVTLAYSVVPPVQVVLLPLIVPPILAVILGFGLWLSALQVKYRDIGNLVSFMLIVGLFITPIVYPFSNVPEEYHLLYGLNPMVGVMELMRWMVLPGSDFLAVPLVVTLVETTALIVTGTLYFGRAERSFADVI